MRKNKQTNSKENVESKYPNGEETDWSGSIALVDKVKLEFVPVLEYRQIGDELRLVATGRQQAKL